MSICYTCGNEICFIKNQEYVFCQKCGCKNFKKADEDINNFILAKFNEYKNETFILGEGISRIELIEEKEISLISFYIKDVDIYFSNGMYFIDFEVSYRNKIFLKKDNITFYKNLQVTKSISFFDKEKFEKSLLSSILSLFKENFIEVDYHFLNKNEYQEIYEIFSNFSLLDVEEYLKGNNSE